MKWHGGIRIGHGDRLATKADFEQAVTADEYVTVDDAQRVRNPIYHPRIDDLFPMDITLDCGCVAHIPTWELFPDSRIDCYAHGEPFVEYVGGADA